MFNKYKIGLIGLLWVCLFCPGFGDSDTNEIKPELMRLYQKKVAEYREKKSKECYNTAAQAAESIVDSVILEMAGRDHYVRPSRPLRPGEKAPQDTMKIHPLFSYLIGRDSVFIDSLFRTDTVLRDLLLPLMDSTFVKEHKEFEGVKKMEAEPPKK